MVPTPKPISTRGRPVPGPALNAHRRRAHALTGSAMRPSPKAKQHKQRIGNVARREEALRYFPLNSDFDRVKSAIKPPEVICFSSGVIPAAYGKLTGHLDCQYQNHGKLMLGIFRSVNLRCESQNGNLKLNLLTLRKCCLHHRRLLQNMQGCCFR